MAAVSLQTGQKVLDTVTLTEQDGVTPVEFASMNVNILSGDVSLGFLANDGTPLPANQIYIVAGLAGVSQLEYTCVAVDGRTKVDLVDVTVTPAPQEILVQHAFGTPESNGLARTIRRR